MRLSQQDDVLAGLCESPHDFPPRWAALLTLYLDESMEQDDGYVVVAGFIGKKSAWVDCGRKWRKALGMNNHLHMRELRAWDKDRNKELLEKLGSIPASCGLTLAYCSLKVSDYRDLMTGTVVELSNEGYITALRMLVVCLMKSLPAGQRMEVICEAQNAFAARREHTFLTLAALPEYQDRNGFSRLAKWSSVPKTSLLEPCDYAAYALLQHLKDPESRKATLCAPILKCNTLGLPVSRADVRELMTTMRSAVPHAFDQIDPDEKRRFHKLLGYIVGTNAP